MTAVHIQNANAFLAGPNSDQSIAWSYVALAQGKLNQDITYPLCLPSDVDEELRATFLEVSNSVADEWNEHTKKAIGDEWPINSIRFYTNVPVEDCEAKSHLHASGVTIKPLEIVLRENGAFDAGNHRLRPRYNQFNDIRNWYPIYMHEFGHILGLADDYKGWSEQGGRPPSMMKMHVALQEEDKAALKFMWNNRNGMGDTQCPDTHFLVDDGYHGIFFAAGAKSCLPYLKDNVVNNPHLAQYNISNPDNCIIFMDDPNTERFLTAGSHHDRIKIESYREQNFDEYFAGAPVHPPICLSEKDAEGKLEPLSVLLNTDNINRADSMWVGKNVHVNIRMLQKQAQGRYITVEEDKYYYPFAWFHNEWSTYNKRTNETQYKDYDAYSISIVDKDKEMVESNIAPLNLQRSAELNPLNWFEPEVIEQMFSQEVGNSCANLNISQSGTYHISRDALSDQEVYCKLDDKATTEKAPSWTYVGFADGMATFKSFFHYTSGNIKVAELHTHLNEEGTSYSNALSSKLKDDEMLIKIRDFKNGPKVFLKYDHENPFFNNMKHRICEDRNTYDLQVKVDWPDSEREQWSNQDRWPDNQYHDAELYCSFAGPQFQNVTLRYKDETLGHIRNNEILEFRLNLAFGVSVRNDEWKQSNPPANPINPNRMAKKHQKSWWFVRNSQESSTPVQINHQWGFEQETGNIAIDALGNNNGVIHGAERNNTSASSHQNYLSFNGVDNSVEITKPAIDTSSSFSVATWVKFDSAKGWQTLVSQDGEEVSGFYLQKTEQGRLAFSLLESDSTASSSIRAESDFNATANTWYHLVGVHDTESQQIKLFVDGMLVATQTFTTPWQATGNTAIGRAQWAGNRVDYFSGDIDSVNTYNRVLTDTEIQHLATSIYASELLFSDDFNHDNVEGWNTFGTDPRSWNDGSWHIADSMYQITGVTSSKAVKAAIDSASDFTYEADVTLNTHGNAGLIFRASNISFGTNSYSGYYAGIDSNGELVLGKMWWDGVQKWTPLKSANLGIQIGKSYRLKVVALEDNIQVYVNGQIKINVNDSTYASKKGLLGLRTHEADTAFDNIEARKILK